MQLTPPTLRVLADGVSARVGFAMEAQEDPVDAMEIGQKLVALCQQGRNLEALDTLYDKDVESVEAMDMPGMPARMKGVDALKKKSDWWRANNELHGGSSRGPFPNGNRFAVIYTFDVTPRSGPMAGQRRQMEEVGLYTVQGDRIVKEEFFYGRG